MNFKGSYLKNEFCYDLQVRNPDDLDDSVFNCTRLPTCAITCEGPYQKILKHSTKESGCMIEWFIHSEWLQLTTAFFVFISLNISRIVLTAGIARICWEHLHPEKLKFISTCTLAGKVLPSDDKKESSQIEDDNLYDIEKSIKSRISSARAQFKLSGYVMIFFALCINGIWIFLLTQIGNTTLPYWLR